MICKKEKECEELQARLTANTEEISTLHNQLDDISSLDQGQKQKILQLQDLASVQKNHLESVEESARTEKEKLQSRLNEIRGMYNVHSISLPS